MRKNRTWRICLVLVASLILVAVIGCSSTAPSSTAPKPAPTSAPTTTSAPSAKPTASPTQSAQPAAKAIKWKAQSYGAPGHETTRYVELFMAKVKERTNGRVTFDYFPAAALYNPYEAFDAMGKGLLDFANCLNQLKPTPMTDFNTAPFFGDLNKVYQNVRKPGSWMDFTAPYFEPYGVKHLARLNYGTYEWAFNKPPKGAEWKLEDFNGRLVSGTTSLKRAMELFGAKFATLPGEERYDALQRGTIDGLGGSTSSLVTTRAYEVGPYIPLTSLTLGTMDFGMSLKLWNSLDPDMKKIINDTLLDADADLAKYGPENYAKDLKFLRDNPKVHVYQVSPAEIARMKAALDPMWKEWEAKYGDAYRKFDQIRNQFFW